VFSHKMRIAMTHRDFFPETFEVNTRRFGR
jgi:hypothetical protein